MSGNALIERIRLETDFGPVVTTLLRENMVADEAQANDQIAAFLQWIALVPTIRPEDAFVMLKTPVDDVFHCFVLNTRFYRDFCTKYFGFFVEHHPLDDATREKLGRGVVETVDRLERIYGDELHPRLKEWRHLIASEAYVVSCGQCGRGDPMTDTIIGKLPNGGVIVH